MIDERILIAVALLLAISIWSLTRSLETIRRDVDEIDVKLKRLAA